VKKPNLLVAAMLGLLPMAAVAAAPSVAQIARSLSPLSPQLYLPGDLDLDPNFMESGSGFVDFNDAFSQADQARRIFPASGGGYWIAGLHGSTGSGSMKIAVAKLLADGSPDGGYRGTGKMTAATTMSTVVDVAKGPGESLYFLGNYVDPTAGDTDFGVLCVDSGGDPCSGFGIGGFKRVYFDQGDSAHHDDIPTRIVYAYSALYVGGSCDTGSAGSANFALCATKMSAADGTLDSGFANAGKYVRNFDLGPDGADRIEDLLAYSPAPFQVRLVIVGDVKRAAAADVDGFIGSIDGITGADETLFSASGYTTVYADLGSGRQDYLTRVIQRANGDFVAAGFALDDTPAIGHAPSGTSARAELLMTAYRADGARDSSFGTNGIVHTLALTDANIPFGIGERPGNRDIVVGLTTIDYSGALAGRQRMQFAQYGASGHVLHDVSDVDFDAAAGVTPAAAGADLLIDGDVVVGAGTRHYADTPRDDDMTAARFIPLDSIFADRFGGSYSD